MSEIQIRSTGTTEVIQSSDGRITLSVPIQIKRRSGRKQMTGKVKNLTEIAALEGVDNSYVSRMVNLTTLAPDIVEAILEDALPDHLTLFDIAVDPPALWEEQRLRIW
jgi:hypothetical protein